MIAERQWEQKGFFLRWWQAGLQVYDELEGIQWEWQAVDGAMTKAPLGKSATGANPTDRGKKGTKRSLLTDGAGIPLAMVIDGANRHDVKLLCATLDGIVIARSEPTEERPQHLCLDAGYDGDSPLRPTYSQPWRGETGESPSPWLSGATLGRRANAFMDQSFASAPGTLSRKKRRITSLSFTLPVLN